jgi:hypothetical protein
VLTAISAGRPRADSARPALSFHFLGCLGAQQAKGIGAQLMGRALFIIER